MTPGQEEQAQDELRSADQAIRAARLLLDEGALQDSASRLYYAVFHAARASLTLRGRYSRTHKGLIELFNDEFGTEPLLSPLLAVRVTADYQIEKFDTTADGLARLIEQADKFIERCRGIVAEAVARGPDEPDPPPDL